jgi:predicted RNA-binding Zn-ribbon protein involved in translation (DUF1610 family)
MVTFTASCPLCGKVSLTPQQIELRVFPDGSADDFYAFTCPHCDERIRKPADHRVVRFLRTGGVEPIEAHGHPETPPPGLPPLTRDDLVDFRELLGRTDRLVAELT